MRIRKNGIIAMEITIARIHLQCENAEGFKETAAYNNSMSFTITQRFQYAKIDEHVI